MDLKQAPILEVTCKLILLNLKYTKIFALETGPKNT